MNKNEILYKSKQENLQGDERERQKIRSSAMPLFIGMASAGIVLMLLELIFLDTRLLIYSVFFMLQIAQAVQNWYLLAKLKKKIYLFVAIGFTFCSILAAKMLYNVFLSMM